MDTKLTWSELRKAVAKQLGAKEEEIGKFLQAYSASIEQGLTSDGQVKINKLGTFKVQAVAPRKSVNVTTGEDFTLPGYNKIVFNPESAVKELVIKGGTPIATTSKPEAAIHPLEKLNEQATEIVDILADLGQTPQAPKAKKIEEPTPPKPVVSQPKPVKDEPKVKRPWLVIGIAILIIVAAISLLFLLLGNKLVATIYELEDKELAQEASLAAEDISNLDQDVAPEATITYEEAGKSSVPYPYTYKQFLATEKLTPGSRLAWLARKYYGEKDLWVFIYEANKDRIPHPSRIEVGTPIRIPKLPTELRDLSNPELRQLVDRLHNTYKDL